jgi:hypothetical protein
MFLSFEYDTMQVHTHDTLEQAKEAAWAASVGNEDRTAFCEAEVDPRVQSVGMDREAFAVFGEAEAVRAFLESIDILVDANNIAKHALDD